MPTRSPSAAPSRAAASSDPRPRAAPPRPRGPRRPARPPLECTASLRVHGFCTLRCRALGTIPCARHDPAEGQGIPSASASSLVPGLPSGCTAHPMDGIRPSARLSRAGMPCARRHPVHSAPPRPAPSRRGPGHPECLSLQPEARPPVGVHGPPNGRHPPECTAFARWDAVRSAPSRALGTIPPGAIAQRAGTSRLPQPPAWFPASRRSARPTQWTASARVHGFRALGCRALGAIPCARRHPVRSTPSRADRAARRPGRAPTGPRADGAGRVRRSGRPGRRRRAARRARTRAPATSCIGR